MRSSQETGYTEASCSARRTSKACIGIEVFSVGVYHFPALNAASHKGLRAGMNLSGLVELGDCNSHSSGIRGVGLYVAHEGVNPR